MSDPSSDPGPSPPRGPRGPSSPPRDPRDASTSPRRSTNTASRRAPAPEASRGDHLRLFVALELPPPVRAALVAFRSAAADPRVWRAVPEEALHATLAFLGRRPAGDVEAVSAIVHDAAGPAPRLALGPALLLPPRRARVLTVELSDPDGALAGLQARVSGALATAGVYVPEKRPFRAHVTVARLRPRERAPRAVEGGPEALEFSGGPLTLFESRLHPGGARYEARARAPLR